jgi:hypothetical protein
MASESKQGKGITAGEVVLGIICPAALFGLWSVQAAEIKAKERKAKPFVEDQRGESLLFCCLGGLAILAVVAKLMGYGG